MKIINGNNMTSQTPEEEGVESLYVGLTLEQRHLQMIAKALEHKHHQLQKARGEWYIGQRLNVFKGDHVVVGVSTMVYDEDCEGEPEWKVTDQIQEVAIAQYYNETSYQKPCWLKVSELHSELDQDKK